MAIASKIDNQFIKTKSGEVMPTHRTSNALIIQIIITKPAKSKPDPPGVFRSAVTSPGFRWLPAVLMSVTWHGLMSSPHVGIGGGKADRKMGKNAETRVLTPGTFGDGAE
jgi:hypothetical protein